MNITLRIGQRTRRAITVTAGTALIAGLGLVAVAPGAMAGPGGQVCDGLDSGKIDTDDEPGTVTITAPAGSLIDGYCVKAGSANNGDGPVYVDVEPTAELTISYPGGKAISHYSYSYSAAPSESPTPGTEEPTPTPTTTTDEPTPTPTTTTDEPTPTPTTTTDEPTPTPTSGTEEPTPTPSTPGGNPNEECPEGTTVIAKFNLVDGVYVAEFGGELITITGDGTGGTFTTADGVVVSVLVIKGGTAVVFDVDGNGSFSNEGLINNGGQVAAISNIQFCAGDDEPTPTPTPTSGTEEPTPTPTTTTDEPTPTPTSGTDEPTPTPTTTTDEPTPTPTSGTDEPTPTPTSGTDEPTPTPTSTTPGDVESTTSTTTPGVTVTTTPAAGPRVLARTGVETWTVALVAGLFLAAGAAMVALTTSTPKGRRQA